MSKPDVAMRRAAAIGAVLVVVAVCAAGATETAVGAIVQLSGPVQIDAFGKGVFLSAARGERIYTTTVIRTGSRGTATLEMQGRMTVILPDTTVTVSILLEGQRRANRLSWLPGLLGVLKDAVASFGGPGSDVILGSKATGTTVADEEWIVEDLDPETLLLDARGAMREGNFLRTLSILETMPLETAGTLPPGEVSFLRGSACFGLGDYAAAGRYLTEAEPLIGGSVEPGAALILPVLLFQLGASRLFVGEDESAAAALSSFAALDADTPFAPYAYQLLLQALVAQGEHARAREVLAQAKRLFAGTAHERDFQSLPPAP